MNDKAGRAIKILNDHFLRDHPEEAAKELEKLGPVELANVVSQSSLRKHTPIWEFLLPETASALLQSLPVDVCDQILSELPAKHAVRLLGFMTEQDRASLFTRLDAKTRDDLETLFTYPPESAGRYMNTTIPVFRGDSTVKETIGRLRRIGMSTARSLFLVDEQQRLTGKVSLADIALANPGDVIGTFEEPISAAVGPIDSIGEVSAIFESGKVLDIPVVDIDGAMLGAVTHEDLAMTVRKDALADMQSMVGASKSERALSSPLFTVRQRMPWLQVNLLTAFLAASVVGFFESTISQMTALAVLLPVVAGQSGNTGAQALAVTMRGLALREITIRQWGKVTRKELTAGLINGVGVSITCGIGVYVWSQSIGLVCVIMMSMVIAMVCAGFAGATIPVLLTRIGQDPATSSSIILTTITDVSGFMAFLGIATLMMTFL